MARFLRAVVVGGVALGMAAGAIAAGCGKSSTSPRARVPDDAAPEDGGSGGRSGEGGSGTTAGGARAAGGGGRSGATGGSGASGFLAGGAGGAVELGVSSQWNCDGAFDGCQGTATGPYSMNGSGLVLNRECTIESSRPRTRADCGEGEQLTCDLAIDASGAQLLVNCECAKVAGGGCGNCTSRTSGDEVPAQCSSGLRICPCAYLGNR